MGLNLYPAPQNPLGFSNTSGNLDSMFNYGTPMNMGSTGPAPAASAAPTVPTVGLPSTPGIAVPDSVMNALSTAQNQPAGGSLADGLGWSSMPFMDKSKVVLGGLGTLANIWSAFQANKIARESLDFQKKAYKTNLENTTQSYNTALSDRANARYAQMGRPEDAAAYIDKNRL